MQGCSENPWPGSEHTYPHTTSREAERATDRDASRNPRSSAPACAPRIENFLQKWITAKPYAQSPPALGFAARTRTENSEHFFTVLQFLMWPHGVEGKHKRMIYR